MEGANSKSSFTSKPIAKLAGPWLRSRVIRMLDGFQTGCLVVNWPDGHQSTHGSPCNADLMSGYGSSDNPVVVQLHSYEPVFALATSGSMGWAESYIEGNWSANSIIGLFQLFLHNEQHFPSQIHGSTLNRITNKVVHRWNRNTLAGSRRNISRHYDLGNDFYQLWLDESMSYSSALFDAPGQTLAEAQKAKMQKIVSSVGAQPGDRVLEIGCGWGAMASTLASESGCDVTGISLSKQQLDYAQQHRDFRAQGGGDTLFEFCDYRNVDGLYEHIVSIEMFEAVGREYWQQYFHKLQSTLKRGGSAVLQVITIFEDRYENYLNKPDFIQKYVFPGGMLPTKTVLAELAEKHGFKINNVDYFGESYATTLCLWRERFESTLEQTRAQGFDESFIRMWRYYLAYCEAGFSTGRTDVGVWQLVKT